MMVTTAAGASSCTAPSRASLPAAIGDAKHGERVVEREACGSCHMIPGMAGAIGVVGPPLKGVAGRRMIAGVLPNTPRQMIQWLKSPQSTAPLSIMPDMGLTDRQARDVAAYLYRLR